MLKWEAEGTPKAVIAIIHSAYEYHNWYMWLIDRLCTQGYEVVMGDLPGHGEAMRRELVHYAKFTQYKEFVQETLQFAAKEQLPVFVIGQGLGATLVMDALHKTQVEVAGAVFMSPWLQLEHTPSKLSSALASMSKIAGNIRLNHGITLNDVTTEPHRYEGLEDPSIYSTTITVSWYHELQSLMKDMYTVPAEEMPDQPMLVMTGGLDRITNTEATRRWLARQILTEFQFKRWAHGSHNLHMSLEREEILRYTTDFFANVLRSIGYIVD